jgi:hypothetical protein
MAGRRPVIYVSWVPNPLKPFQVLDNGNPTSVFHGIDCRCMNEHGPYADISLSDATARGLRPCGYGCTR